MSLWHPERARAIPWKLLARADVTDVAEISLSFPVHDLIYVLFQLRNSPAGAGRYLRLRLNNDATTSYDYLRHVTGGTIETCSTTGYATLGAITGSVSRIHCLVGALLINGRGSLSGYSTTFRGITTGYVYGNYILISGQYRNPVDITSIQLFPNVDYISGKVRVYGLNL